MQQSLVMLHIRRDAKLREGVTLHRGTPLTVNRKERGARVLQRIKQMIEHPLLAMSR